MYGYLLQDWITIQGNALNSSVTQSEADWMSFQKFQDILFWVEVRAVTLAGATNVNLQFETAPTKDPTAFTAMRAATQLVSGTTPLLAPVLLSAGAGAGFMPLARWTRWSAFASGGALSGNWSATFRVSCAANNIMRG